MLQCEFVIAPNCLFFPGTPFMWRKHAQFCYKQKFVFQGEIILNFFHIHCELISILLLVKTAKRRRGCVCFFLFLLQLLEYPYSHLKSQKSNQNWVVLQHILVFQIQIWCH